MCGVFVDDSANGGWFLLCVRLMLLWMMCVGFNNTCTVSEKWNFFRVIARHFGWAYKNLTLSISGWKRCCGYECEIESYGYECEIESFYLICVQNQWGHKTLNPIEDSDIGGQSSIIVRMEYLLAIRYWHSEPCAENQWGRSKKHCFANFSSLIRFWMRGFSSLILFSPGILAEAVSVTHSDMF